MEKKYRRIVIGGTFDLLHRGHEDFLNRAFSVSDFVVIGLTSDSFNIERNKHTVQNQKTRKELLEYYLNRQGFKNRYRILVINNIEGETLVDGELQGMIVTAETEKNAVWINKERKLAGLKPLDLIKIRYVKSPDNKVISSSRIRMGEINASGTVYKKILSKFAGRELGDSIRQKLKTPQGILIKSITEIKPGKTIVAVGDITVRELYENNIVPKLSIIDYKTRRKTVFNSLSQLHIPKINPDYMVENPPGNISAGLTDAIESALHSGKEGLVICVDGEEDLAVIPAVLLSPLETRIYYGQPDQGLIEITVTSEVKDRVLELLTLE